MTPPEQTTTSVRFEREVAERLKLAARERLVSVNLLIERAVVEFLDRLIPVAEIVANAPTETGTGEG